MLSLKRHFARYGIPEVLRTDNGPQFASNAFRNFSREWSFSHVTSSPRYPQSNGKVENSVKTAKRLMLKAKQSGTDPWLALLAFRNTPTQGFTSSPAQRLMGRRTRTTLPTHIHLLEPQFRVNSDEADRSRATQKLWYDRHAKDLPALSVGDTVRIQPSRGHSGWTKARVQRKLGHRSYELQTTTGLILRRNRRQLRKTQEDVQTELVEEETDDDPSDEELPETQPNELGRPQQQGYITRSGRVSRPPDRYSS